MIFKNKDLKNNTFTKIPSITNFFMLYSDLKNKTVNRNLIKSLKNIAKKKISISLYKPRSQII